MSRSSVEASLLSRVPLFRDMPGEALRHLCNQFEERWCEPGEMICREGEAGDAIFFIESGHVTVSLSGADDQQIQLSADLWTFNRKGRS